MAISNHSQHNSCKIKSPRKFPLGPSFVRLIFDNNKFHHAIVIIRYVVFGFESTRGSLKDIKLLFYIKNCIFCILFKRSSLRLSSLDSRASKTAAPISKYVKVHTTNDNVRTFCRFIALFVYLQMEICERASRRLASSPDCV